MLKQAEIHTDVISEKSRSYIDVKGAYKAVIINQSANLIYVNRCPIAALTEREFDLGNQFVFKSNMDLDTGQNTESSVEIYVVKFREI